MISKPPTSLEFLSPNTTATLQPLDVGIICILKAYYCPEFLQLAQVKEEGNVAVNSFKISHLEAREIAKHAWSLM